MNSSFQDLSDWVVQVTNCEQPKDPESIEWLRDGIVLCTLLAKLQPGILEDSKINRHKDSMPFGWIENIGLYLQTCKKIGLHPDDLFVTADLFQNRDPQLVFRNITAVAIWARNIPAVKTRMLARAQTITPKNSISPPGKLQKRRSEGDVLLSSSPPTLHTSMPDLPASRLILEEFPPSSSRDESSGASTPEGSPKAAPSMVPIVVPASPRAANREMDDLWDQVKSLKKKLMTLEVDNESLVQDKEDLQKQLTEKEEEAKRLTETLASKKEEIARFDAVQKELAEKNKVNSTLVSRVEELEVRLQKLEFERQNLEIERRILESEKQSMMKSSSGLTKSISHDSSLNDMAAPSGSPSGRSGRSFTVSSIFRKSPSSVREASPKPKKSGSPLATMFSRKKSNLP